MTVQLEIEDGQPWYLSPDIWVVPGTDPTGPPGVPVVGAPGFMWARVHNKGDSGVQNATVRYYWCNPTTLISQANANLVGTSYVSLAAGEAKDVLCLVPWIPTWVNNGHECLIAETFDALDPLPPRAPTDWFNPPGDRHVAQRNIDLVYATPHSDFGFAVLPFAAGNTGRFAPDNLKVRVRRAPIRTLAKLTPTLGLKRLPPNATEIKQFGVRSYGHGDPLKDVGPRTVATPIKPGDVSPLALIARVPAGCRGGALLLVEQLSEGKVVGGVGVLVLGEHARPRGRRR